jgi:hypothetical protein
MIDGRKINIDHKRNLPERGIDLSNLELTQNSSHYPNSEKLRIVGVDPATKGLRICRHQLSLKYLVYLFGVKLIMAVALLRHKKWLKSNSLEQCKVELSMDGEFPFNTFEKMKNVFDAAVTKWLQL